MSSVVSPRQNKSASLSSRLLYGVEENGLALASLRVSGLGRAGIKKLVKEGYDSKKAVREAPLPLLVKLVPEKIAMKLKEAVESQQTDIKEARDETTTSEPPFTCQDCIEISSPRFPRRRGGSQLVL